MITNIILGTAILILAILDILHTAEIIKIKKVIGFLALQIAEERE